MSGLPPEALGGAARLKLRTAGGQEKAPFTLSPQWALLSSCLIPGPDILGGGMGEGGLSTTGMYFRGSGGWEEKIVEATADSV